MIAFHDVKILSSFLAVLPPPIGLVCLVNAHCQHAQCECKVAGVARDDIGDAAATDAIMVHGFSSCAEL